MSEHFPSNTGSAIVTNLVSIIVANGYTPSFKRVSQSS